MILLLTLHPIPSIASEVEQSMPNVLFLVVDDLRVELGCYGETRAKTPHIDALASRGLLFERAYCQQAVCSPSRTSVLTGLRPDSTKVWDLETDFRNTVPDVVTLPQHFRQHGYHTQSIGKVFHKSHMQDDAMSWSIPSRRAPGSNWINATSRELLGSLQKSADKHGLTGKPRYYATLGPPTESADSEDDGYPDGRCTEMAIEALQRYSDTPETPFFLAVGFIKPHLPFCAPTKYWDMYSREDLTLPANPLLPENCPKCAASSWGELRNYAGMPEKGPVADHQARKLIHGYLACVSYIDTQIGKLLSELEELGMDGNTIVVLWSDHGWKLGEHGLWSKHTNFELDTRVPLIFSGPGMNRKERHPRH